jgi:hypothetical protein
MARHHLIQGDTDATRQGGRAWSWMRGDEPEPDASDHEWLTWSSRRVSWTCAACGKWVRDHGEIDIDPDVCEAGHAPTCTRHQAAAAAYERRYADEAVERLIPDDDLGLALSDIEELCIGATDDETADPTALPVRARAAAARLWAAIAPTQGEAGAERYGRLLHPDGRYEHAPARRVEILQADVDILAELSTALDPGATTFDEYLMNVVERRSDDWDRVDDVARTAHRVRCIAATLSYIPTGRIGELAATVPWDAQDVTLTVEQEAAYQDWSTVILNLLHPADPEAAFVYRFGTPL